MLPPAAARPRAAAPGRFEFIEAAAYHQQAAAACGLDRFAGFQRGQGGAADA
ncbi:hypothetical protein LNV28_01995 [Paucibacter sp. DJ2R-2]|nr:hypothetical protein [Paucibacter sp. DJ2R-2]